MNKIKYNGEKLANALTDYGLPVEFVTESESPRTICYHFNYKDIFTYTKSKEKMLLSG